MLLINTNVCVVSLVNCNYCLLQARSTPGSLILWQCSRNLEKQLLKEVSPF